MTFTKKLTGRRAGRHTLRHDEQPARRLDAWHGTEATRSALIHTTREWNALRHAC